MSELRLSFRACIELVEDEHLEEVCKGSVIWSILGL